MLSLLACALTLAQAPIDQPTRLRTVLPNGSVVLVERVPSAKSLSLQLFVSARTGGTFGERHLIEHLTAVGDGMLDQRLETAGATLRAQTYREATVYELDLPSNKLELGLSAVRELLKPRTWPKDVVAKEAAIIRQEAALREGSLRFSEAAWRRIYGEAGAGPFDLADPAPLKTDLAAPDVALVLAGNVSLDQGTAQLKALIDELPETTRVSKELTPVQKGGEVQVDASGSAVAVSVPSFRNPVTAAILSAALALASEIPKSFVTYTPSARSGLVILGTRGRTQLDPIIRDARATALFSSGKLMGRRWVQHQLEGVAKSAFSRGMLLVQERDLRPETMRENVDAMTLAQFQAGLDAFKGSTAVLINGRASDESLPSQAIEEALAKPVTRGSSVIEIIDASAAEIHLHAVVALPPLDAADKAYLPMIVRALSRGTQDYPRKDALIVTGGSAIDTHLMPDHVGISFTVPKEGLAGGLSLMNSILRSASLLDEDLQTDIGPKSAWEVALQPVTYANPRFNRDKALEVYARVFRPEHVTLAVGGPIRERAAISGWSSILAKWMPRKISSTPRGGDGAALFTGNSEGVDIIEIASALPASSAATYPRLLALFALGSGKGSGLFQTVRQALGFSYRQEAVLVPSVDGFQTKLLIATERGSGSQRLSTIQEALGKEIDSWSSSHRSRALAIAEGVIDRGNEESPFYLSGEEPIFSDLGGRTFMAAYWQMKTGLPWNPALMLTNLRDVPLDELKEAAQEIVQGKARVIKG